MVRTKIAWYVPLEVCLSIHADQQRAAVAMFGPTLFREDESAFGTASETVNAASKFCGSELRVDENRRLGWALVRWPKYCLRTLYSRKAVCPNTSLLLVL